MSRSSTSSSELGPKPPKGWRRWPWAGLTALLLVLAVDQLGLGLHGPWKRLESLVPPQAGMERGLVRDRLALRTMAENDDPQRLLVIGSSRVQKGFLSSKLRQAFGDQAAVYRFAHPGMEAFETRALVEELGVRRGDVVLFLWSEFDTHRPLIASAATSPASWRSTVELARRVGWRQTWQERQAFLRLLLADGLATYRYRPVLGQAGLWSLRRFPGRQGKPPAIAGPRPLIDNQASRRPIDKERGVERAQRFLPDVGPRALWAQIGQCNQIAAGPHVAVNMALRRSTLELLRQAGAEVVIVEGPVHPVARTFYDPGLRQETVEFLDRQRRDLGVHLVLAEQIGELGPGHFSDLTHVNERGCRRLLRPLRPLLPQLWQQASAADS